MYIIHNCIVYMLSHKENPYFATYQIIYDLYMNTKKNIFHHHIYTMYDILFTLLNTKTLTQFLNQRLGVFNVNFQKYLKM